MSRKGHRYSICGLSRARKKAIDHIESTASLHRLRWHAGALFLAFAICAVYVVCLTPIVVADPAHGAPAIRYSFDDFANAASR